MDTQNKSTASEDIKTIDLLEVAKNIWKLKYVIILFTAAFLAFGFFQAKNEKPVYMTSVWVRLPQYVNTQTVNTAMQYANGNMLRNLYIQQGIDPDNPTINVVASVMDKSSIIKLQFVGENPQDIKNFADLYQAAYVNGVNQFVNEDVLVDLEMLKAQGANGTIVNVPARLGQAEVIKDGAVPTVDINTGAKNMKVIKLGLLGFFLGIGLGVLRYGLVKLKE